MDNMEKFNKLVGLIFGRLYGNFPTPLHLKPAAFLELVISEDDEDGSFNFSDYFSSTVKWLEEEDYIRISQDRSSSSGVAFDVVLSERGLEALRRVPDSLEGKESIGERLANFSKLKASETISTLISLAITTTL